jgi:hypothetical protein
MNPNYLHHSCPEAEQQGQSSPAATKDEILARQLCLDYFTRTCRIPKVAPQIADVQYRHKSNDWLKVARTVGCFGSGSAAIYGCSFCPRPTRAKDNEQEWRHPLSCTANGFRMLPRSVGVGDGTGLHRRRGERGAGRRAGGPKRNAIFPENRLTCPSQMISSTT